MMSIALIQMNSGTDISDNLHRACSLIDDAAPRADMVLLPEHFLYIGPDKQCSFSVDSPHIHAVRERARRHNTYILAGTFAEGLPGQKKIHNTSLLIDGSGEIAAVYRKMHLFDVALGESVEFNESLYVEPGAEPVCADTPVGTMGMSICYDVRFPELYRVLALRGADVFCVPANFALMTGRDHWLTLLRARAIENGAYVLAPAQWGKKYDGNVSYGRSAVIDPWGTIVAQASDSGDSVLCAQIDPSYTRTVRRTIPSLTHIRIFNLNT